MPMRVIRPILDHIDRHPKRLIVTILAVLVCSSTLASVALVRTVDLGRQGRIENCRAISELERKLFITFTDWQVDPGITRKFLPTTNCEDIP